MQELTDQIAQNLLHGVSVLLTGLPQSGRSHQAGLVGRQLSQRGANVVTLKGNRQLATRPLAALSLQIGTGAEGPGGPTMQRVLDALVALMKSPGSVLVIDDADAFDPVSLALIAEARRDAAWTVLMIGGMGQVADAALAGLIEAAQPGVQITLPGMPLEDISRLANQLVGGVVGPFTVSRIATLSGGLPGLIRAVVATSRENGHLVLQDGVWVAAGNLWDDALGFALRPVVQDLEQGELDALTRLANLSAVAEDSADELLGDATLRQLWHRGLLRADLAGLQVFPPALGEWLRRKTDGSPDSPASAGVANAVTITARIRVQWRDRVERHWTIWRDDKAFENAVPLLLALFTVAADDDRIPIVFSQTNRGAEDAHITFVIVRAAFTALWQHNLSEAQAELERLGRAQPVLVTYLRGVGCLLSLACDRVPDERSLVWTDDDVPRAIEMMNLAQAEALIAQGAVTDAVDRLAEVGQHDSDLAIVVSPIRGLAALLNGDLEAGTDQAVKGFGQSLVDMDRLSISGHAYVASLGLFLSGRFEEFTAITEIAHRLGGTDVFQSNYRVGLLVLGSLVAHMGGRADHTHVMAVQAALISAGAGPLPGMASKPQVLLDHTVTADEIWDQVDDLIDRQFVFAAVFLAAVTVDRCTPSPRAGRLVALGSACQSPFLRLLTKLVGTVNAGESGGFRELVDEMRDSCGPLFTTWARIAWAVELRASGDMDGWLRQADIAWQESRQMDRQADGLFHWLVAAVDLTLRETDVARLALDGLSSTKAARALGVSPRTVEAYLQAVYRKTGVNSREALQRIGRTWLRLPSD